MTVHMITESCDTVSVSVDTDDESGAQHVDINAYEALINESILVRLTRDESDQLIDALVAANRQIDATSVVPS